MHKRKIYILSDMEGISGVRLSDQVRPGPTPEYAEGCRLMRAEINVAIGAAFEGGADEVLVCDTHVAGGQVLIAEMDSRASYELPVPGDMMPGLDESFAGLILLGHHARAGTLKAFLDHTMSSESWFECRLNGRAIGEIGIEATFAGQLGVPVIAVTGDLATRNEAREQLGDIPCAVVKDAVCRNRAHCLSLPEAHARVRSTLVEAVRDPSRYTPFRPAIPLNFSLTYYRTDMADETASRLGYRRVDARTVECTIDRLRGVRLFT